MKSEREENELQSERSKSALIIKRAREALQTIRPGFSWGETRKRTFNEGINIQLGEEFSLHAGENEFKALKKEHRRVQDLGL
jgi:hypothetical protein